MDTNAYGGLTTVQARGILQTHGSNALITEHPQSAFVTFLQEFKNPLILILLAAAVIALGTGALVSGILIISIVCISSVLDFTISHRSEQAAKALAARVSPKAYVIRDGAAVWISPEEVVPHDALLLSAGNVIAADGIVRNSGTLYVNEAALTGESIPVEKRVGDMVYRGSGVVSGTGCIEITETGRDTKFAGIAALLTQRPKQGEFERGIRKFSIMLTKVIVVLVIVIFLINAYLKQDIASSVLFSLALAVGLAPDLLPVIIAVNLSRASIRMSRHGVIVKKLSAIENFGSMDILCTDKTGTLTEDKIVVVKYLDVAGDTSSAVLEAAYVSSVLKGTSQTPLDEAIIARETFDITAYRKVHEIPFDFERRRDTMVVERAGEILMICKGAPEAIVSISTEGDTLVAHAQFEELSRQGYRVIAVATRSISAQERYGVEDEHDFVFQGYIAFIDPPKIGIKEILEDLRQKSIEIKVITGDHRLVAEHIGREVGLLSKGTLDAQEIDALDDATLGIRLEQATIFARVTPLQKNRIITVLQSRGHTIGYMGDGINDAPALRSADVGISVDNALDVAKESADIVLTNKDFNQLLEGVKEGRRTFANTQKYIGMAVSSNFGNMISMTGATLFLPFLPMLPAQILLNNLLYESTQTALIADHVDAEVLNKPRPWDIKALTRFMIVFGILSSVFDLVLFYILYRVYGLGEAGFQTAWFMQSFFSQVCAVFFIRTVHAVWKARHPHRLVIIAAISATVVAWTIALTKIGHAFGFTAIPGYVISSIVGLTLVYFASIEVVKYFFYRSVRTPKKVVSSWLERSR